MHGHLRGGPSLPAEVPAVDVNHDEIVLGEQPFVAAGLRTQDISRGEPDREISVHGHQQIPLVAQTAELDELPPQLCLVHSLHGLEITRSVPEGRSR